MNDDRTPTHFTIDGVVADFRPLEYVRPGIAFALAVESPEMNTPDAPIFVAVHDGVEIRFYSDRDWRFGLVEVFNKRDAETIVVFPDDRRFAIPPRWHLTEAFPRSPEVPA